MYKKYLRTKNIFLVILAISLFAVFFKFLSLLSFPDPNIVLEKGDPAIKLPAKNSLTQKFTAQRDNLVKVEFLLRTPGIEFENNDKVEMRLADENCQNPIREGYLQASFLNSKNLYEFGFPKVKDSKNQTYCLIATFKPSKGKAKAIQFFVFEKSPGTFLPENPATQEKYPSSLSIRPAYANGNLWQNLEELNQRISQYKPWFLKHYYLAAIALSFIVISIFSLILLIRL